MNLRDETKYNICRFLKLFQFLFVLLVIVLEIVQAIKFTQFFRKLVYYLDIYYSSDNSYDNGGYTSYSYSTGAGTLYYYSPILSDPSPNLDPAELYFTNTSVGKGPAVIWIYIVMILSFLSIIGYGLMFSKIWNYRQHIGFIVFDAAFLLLWISEVFTNLIWIYNEVKSPCYLTSISDYYSVFVSVYLPELKNLCGAYKASNVFGWFTLALFIISLGFSFIVYNDANSEAKINQAYQFNNNNIDNINNMTVILQPSQQQIQTPLQEESLQDNSSQAESLQELPQIGEPSSAA